jgi:hypothetical protein
MHNEFHFILLSKKSVTIFFGDTIGLTTTRNQRLPAASIRLSNACFLLNLHPHKAFWVLKRFCNPIRRNPTHLHLMLCVACQLEALYGHLNFAQCCRHACPHSTVPHLVED